MENKINNLIDGVLETRPSFWDNPNGGHVYTCPFCCSNKEVKATDYVHMSELKHDKDCTYLLAKEIYELNKD